LAPATLFWDSDRDQLDEVSLFLPPTPARDLQKEEVTKMSSPPDDRLEQLLTVADVAANIGAHEQMVRV
jgi:hypothetical protein